MQKNKNKKQKPTCDWDEWGEEEQMEVVIFLKIKIKHSANCNSQ